MNVRRLAAQNCAQRKEYLRLWRRVRQDRFLKRAPNYWELARLRGLTAPISVTASPRIRQLLKTLSEHRNLMKEDVLVDTSQSARRVRIRADGVAMALTHSCGSIFAPYFGEFLSPQQCLALQGVDPQMLPSEGVSQAALYSMAGMGMSCPVVGSLMYAVMGQLRPA